MMLSARKLVGISVAVWMLSLAAIAVAAGAQFTAQLEGTVMEPRAEGRALWEADRRGAFLSVVVTNVNTTDLASVYIDGEFVDVIEIREDGVGMLETSDSESVALPHVRAGSTLAVFDATKNDVQGPLLVGTFRVR